eukprot:297003_1
MALFSILFFTIQFISNTRFCESSSHSCDATNTCATVDCSPNENCDITCSGSQSCENAAINCNNANYACNISCSLGKACFNTRINGKDALSLTITTPIGGTNILENATIICPNNGSCSIDCRQDHKVCESMIIKAESSTSFNLICRHEATTCHNIKIYCPIHDTINRCTIEGTPNTNPLNMQHIDIYSRNGFHSVNIIGPKTDFPSISIGSIHCANGYTSSCIIDENNNNICKVNETDKTCENVTPVPTTASPLTATPTTNTPITSIPTTFIPTTNSPTTNIPTTLIPTTFSPTTSVPTSANPTTDIPTTNVPTTISPASNYPNTVAPTTYMPTTKIPTYTAPTISTHGDKEVDDTVTGTDYIMEANVAENKIFDDTNILIIVGGTFFVILLLVVISYIYWKHKRNQRNTCTIANTAAVIDTDTNTNMKTVEMVHSVEKKKDVKSPSIGSSINSTDIMITPKVPNKVNHLDLDTGLEDMYRNTSQHVTTVGAHDTEGNDKRINDKHDSEQFGEDMYGDPVATAGDLHQTATTK